MSQSIETTPLAASNRFLKLLQERLASQVKIPFEISIFDGSSYHFGSGRPQFEIKINDRNGLLALSQLDECRLCEAYMDGSIDIIGNMLEVMSLQSAFTDSHPLHHLWRRITPVLTGQVFTDKRSIAQHYDFDPEFYLSFLDESRCYSQAIFERDDEALNVAQRRKFDYVISACRLQKGDRLLDVGGGWGALTEHAGRQGIEVTSLTISQESMSFLTDLIERLQLPCRVLQQNFLEYELETEEKYDAIAILGVMEHLPNYEAVLEQCQRLLKPGGRVYLDASSIREKHKLPTFISTYIYPGNHSFFCLHDFLEKQAKTPFELDVAFNDRHSYYLTCKIWAENLDRSREGIVERWGESLYRRFHLYLWSSAYAFLNHRLDAYRVVLWLPQND
ncbi:class I SAM-dependent methyltransferase [Roseofilum casamattae]|uniref:Class I SAM-dependent methyltransferase n=1 Tax=Roseofilum casamattae BLCC-M143 TaxID=3022442 RepID=A0ABT7BRU0_9CYAN|nr:class I SAM-dependent methyltransferase [Roseofilum casamattae]MDJ1181905.1 class I SAM-dependent methyltransferase [Roseofilum casamattae BLCC-M143]